MYYDNGILFDSDFIGKLKEKFYFPDFDPEYGGRLFFDNSGGSLRLAAAVKAKNDVERFPDCPDRTHQKATELKELVTRGTSELLEIVFSAEGGSLISELTASQVMFQIVGMIMENIPGTNAVVSSLEHPSAYDAVEYYCKKTGKEMRVIPANSETGEIEPEAVMRLVDENTTLLSVTSASNVCGVITDLRSIVAAARAVKPDIYIVSDAVQHAPHAPLNVAELKLDGANFAPYKFFGVRGCGFGYVSERVAALPHHKLIAKPQQEFALGTSSPGNFAAAIEIINYVCEIGAHFISEGTRKDLFQEGMRRIHLQERALLYRILEGTPEIPGLRHIPGVTVYTDKLPLSRRDLIAAIGIDGLDSTSCAQEYEKRGVIVCDRSIDSIYSRRIVKALNIPGCVRVSPLHCHTTEDIDMFLKITAEIACRRAYRFESLMGNHDSKQKK